MANLFYKAVLGLSNIKRFPTHKSTTQYNCAEHSYRVAMLSMLIVDEYNSNPNHLVKIDKAEVLSKALIHDLEESKINDIPSPVKTYPGLRDLLRKASEEILTNDILDKTLTNRQYYLDMWKEDKDGESGEIISLADKLEALLVAKEECERGNMDYKESLENIWSWFKAEEGQRLLKKFPLCYDLIDENLK